MVLAVCALAVVLPGADRLLLKAEQQGYIYYRRSRSSPATRAGAALELHALMQPAARHVLEVQRREHVEEDGEGGPDDPGREPCREAGAGPRRRSTVADR
jgi:hypothetical protein